MALIKYSKESHPVFPEGSQQIWQYSNGYGASVVMHSGSYGGDEGLYELAVVQFQEDGSWSITYDTVITEDVLGYLNEEEVQDTLREIEKL